MKKYLSILPRWIPALLMMIIIFLFSSRTTTELPNFLGWDYVIKKTAHVVVYGLLALAFFFWFHFLPQYQRLAWLLALLYAATDEFHQSFVPGRHASIMDVLVFDNFGALLALWLYSRLWRRNEEEIQQK
jgi:VanZ family protein